MRILATAALAFSAAVCLAQYILPLSALLPLAVCLAVLGALIALARRRWLTGLVLALVFAALGLARYSQHYAATVAQVKDLEGESYTVTARLSAYPEVYSDYVRLQVELTTPGLPSLGALVYDDTMSSRDYIPGQTVSFTGVLRDAGQVYGQDYDNYYSRGQFFKITSQGEVQLIDPDPGWRYCLQRLSRSMAQRMDQVFPQDVAPFMRSLLLGDRSQLYQDEALQVQMTRAGFMHIVAVSGMNVAFIAAVVQLILGSGRGSSLVCLILVALFVPLVGAPPSAVRAGFMQVLLLLAPLLRRENDPITSLALILSLLLLQEPFAAASISLQLSFAAMAGLLIFSGPMYRRLSAITEGRGGALRRYVLANASSSIGVMVFTLPLTLVHFGYIPVLSPISNLLGLWTVSLSFQLGWAACILSVIPALGMALGWLSAWPVRLLLLIGRAVSAAPFAVVYLEQGRLWPWLICCYLAFILAWPLRKRPLLRWGLPAALTIASLALMLHSARDDYLSRPSLTVIDVGQGQCVAAMSGDTTVVIDCGNLFSLDNAGETAGRYLLSRGRRGIDALAIAQLDEEHMGGVTMLMEHLRVDKLLIPKCLEDEDGLLPRLLERAAEKGTEVVELTGSGLVELGDIRLTYQLPSAFHGRYDNSVIYTLAQGEYTTLIPGDSPSQRELHYARSHDLSGVDILVVGDHGSDYSSAYGFLRAIGGGTAVVSVGYNYFGLPQEDVLERLELCGYNVYRTDRDGTVELRMPG